jgi:hypothetical protein
MWKSISSSLFLSATLGPIGMQIVTSNLLIEQPMLVGFSLCREMNFFRKINPVQARGFAIASTRVASPRKTGDG